MPQLIMGPGNPIAVSIEAGALAYIGMTDTAFLPAGPMMRAAALAGIYYAYNVFLVPGYLQE